MRTSQRVLMLLVKCIIKMCNTHTHSWCGELAQRQVLNIYFPPSDLIISARVAPLPHQRAPLSQDLKEFLETFSSTIQYLLSGSQRGQRSGERQEDILDRLSVGSLEDTHTIHSNTHVISTVLEGRRYRCWLGVYLMTSSWTLVKNQCQRVCDTITLFN